MIHQREDSQPPLPRFVRRLAGQYLSAIGLPESRRQLADVQRFARLLIVKVRLSSSRLRYSFPSISHSHGCKFQQKLALKSYAVQIFDPPHTKRSLPFPRIRTLASLDLTQKSSSYWYTSLERRRFHNGRTCTLYISFLGSYPGFPTSLSSGVHHYTTSKYNAVCCFTIVDKLSQ